MHKKVYSYIRFSTPEQAKGHSLERQSSYAQEYAEKNNLILDESLTLKDEGLSAYHQKHIQKGALGTFCKAIDDGLIIPGSVLIVENLDRLNRGKVRLAMPFLLNIVNSGITVITASDGREYSQSSLDENNYQLFESLSIMSRAHEESETKSKRVKAAILAQIKHWIDNGHGKVIRNGADPYWCRQKNDKTGFDLIPERVEIIKHIIDLYLKGWGYNKIVIHLNENYTPFKGQRWYVQYLTSFIKNRTLIGERSFTLDNEKYIIPNYYPSILTEDEFFILQKAIKNRASTKSQRSIPSIITGMRIAYCGICGEVLCAQNYSFRSKNGILSDGFRRIRCNAKNNGKSCPNSKSTSIAPIEKAILEYCSDKMELTSVLGDNDKTIQLRANILSSYKNLDHIEKKLKTGEESILSLLSQGQTISPVVNKVVEQLRVEKNLHQQKTLNLEEELRFQDRGHAIDITEEWQNLKSSVYSMDQESRLLVRQLVKRTFKRFNIFLHGYQSSEHFAMKNIKTALKSPRDSIDLIMTFPNDKTRILSIDKKSGSWINGGDVAIHEASLIQGLAGLPKAETEEPA